jgi:short-subunit dehydrogenase
MSNSTNPIQSLANARVWVTGASAGIGAALVKTLVARGARVAVTARRRDLLEQIAKAHGGPDGSRVLVVPADVTDRDAVAVAARTIRGAWGAIDLAIFNAGGIVEGDFVKTMTLNYSSVVYGVEAVVNSMLARGQGHIAAVASLAGYRPSPVAQEYGASKAAVIYLMDGLRFTLAPKGIKVTVINPGFVRTPLTDRNKFRMPFLIEADDAAERIVRGLERGKQEIHFPAPLSWTAKVLRVLPYPLYERLIRALRRAPATEEPPR